MRLPIAALLTVALSLALAGPAAASGSDFDATIDCGSGPVEVTSTPSLWAPLTDVASDQKYKPVAWNVEVRGNQIEAAKRTGSKKVLVDCAYSDGVATGTVTVTLKKQP